jgi:DNA (cytosine-5)-methyltransferase 1
MLRVLDLFSGIGGFSLGLERTGGFETVAFCEIEPFCQRVLAKHWPKVPIYDDVRELTGARLAADGIAVDVICGGFPCQDISTAGRRAGMDGTRSGLWSEIARLMGELRPRFVFVENVSGLLSGPSEQPGGWFGRVLGDVAALGYDAEWNCISASAIGAPHHRDRIWLVAYPNSVGLEADADNAELRDATNSIGRRRYTPQLDRSQQWDTPRPSGARVFRVDNGVPADVDCLKALGNAVVPQIPELIGKAILEAEGGC